MDMDIERLNKTQIILLTLLVSFVTSIATGVATVSLMERAPTDVTRVISRIVEKPIETITTGKTEVITKEQTVVVNESEQIAEAIANVAPSIVRIYSVSGKTKTFEGLGVIISEEGMVLADRRMVRNRTDYMVRLNSGVELAADPADSDDERGLFTLSLDDDMPALKPAKFKAFDALALGQTVVAVGGETSTRISPGVIAELLPTTSPKEASRVRTTIDSSSLSLGTPLVSLDGAVVGMPEDVQSRVFLSLYEQAQ